MDLSIKFEIVGNDSLLIRDTSFGKRVLDNSRETITNEYRLPAPYDKFPIKVGFKVEHYDFYKDFVLSKDGSGEYVRLVGDRHTLFMDILYMDIIKFSEVYLVGRDGRRIKKGTIDKVETMNCRWQKDVHTFEFTQDDHLDGSRVVLIKFHSLGHQQLFNTIKAE